MNSLTTVEDEKRLLERQRLRTERKLLRRQERAAKVAGIVERVMLTAAKQVDLKKHIFKSDKELQALGLKEHEVRMIRGWQEPKRHAPFALESSSKLLEAKTRATTEKTSIKLNVQNMVVLPEKRPTDVTPVVIDVEPEERKK